MPKKQRPLLQVLETTVPASRIKVDGWLNVGTHFSFEIRKITLVILSLNPCLMVKSFKTCDKMPLKRTEFIGYVSFCTKTFPHKKVSAHLVPNRNNSSQRIF